MPLPNFTALTDGVDDILASHHNVAYDEIEQIAAATPHADYVNTETLAATLTLTDADEPLQYLDPGGAGRQVNLPAEAATNHPFYIVNRADADEDLTVKDDGGATIVVIGQDEARVLVSNGVAWEVISGGAAAASMTNSNISPTTANVTAAVNTRYFADVSGLTANRNFVLPAGAIGDVIELDIKVGDGSVIGTDFALIVIGDTGIKINGGATATAWKKVWLTGDSIKLVADATDNWQVVVDGRVWPRGLAEASSATPTIDVNNEDYHRVTALAAAITSMTSGLSGTPIQDQRLVIEITDNGTARAITWGASFEASTVALPTTTVISTLLSVGFIYNGATSKWRCVAAA